MHGEAPVDRKEAAEALAAATGAVLAQVLGRTFLLYKRHPKTPKIQLPKPGAPVKSAKSVPTPKAAKDARPRAPHSLEASEKRRDTTGDEDVEVEDPDDDDED